MNLPSIVLDLFAGPGGWSEGIRQHLGLRDVGVEFDTTACLTRAAAGHCTVRADVTALSVAAMAGRVSGFIASPPCQAWSRAGKRLGLADQPIVHQALHDLSLGRDTRAGLLAECKDPRSLLAAEPMRYLYAIRPEWICMEEVPDVLPLWRHYAEILRGWGYSVWCGELNAADYGVPQTRGRAVLMASRVLTVTVPQSTHAESAEPDTMFGPGRPQRISMARALGFAAGVVVNTRGERKTRGGNEFPADGPSWALTEKARSWKLISRRDSPNWVAVHGARENRSVDQPAPTITGEAHRWYWKAGDDESRLGIAEAAVLQSFPADYPWRGSRTAQFLQAGNAVPPLLAAHVVSAAAGVPFLAARAAA